jgi:hypothetical protein
MISYDYLNLAPVLLAGTFAIVGTLAGNRLSHVNEHSQWLRNEKMMACSEYLSTAERLVDGDLKSGDPQAISSAVGDAHNLSHARLTLVCPLDVVSAAIKLRESVVDVATLLAERSRVGPDPVWDEHVHKAFEKAHREKIQFVFESSKDLNSGIFKGLGPFRTIAIFLLRWKGRLMERRLA